MTTSSDGILTATADSVTASIKLAVDFTGYTGGVPAAAVNLIRNPSDEVATGMFADTGASVARSTAQAFIGTASTALTCTTAGTIAANCGVGTAGQQVSPGVTYTASAYARSDATARQINVSIDWYDAAGAYISSSNGTASLSSTTAWLRYTATGAAPATAFFATVKVYVAAAVLSEVHYVDARQLEAGSAATAYCDGTQAGCYWIGTAHASESVRPPYNRVTARRADGTIVRGLDLATAPAGIVDGIDHEAPLGTEQVYTAALSNGYGTLTSTTATATITAATDMVWLKHLTTPALSVQVPAKAMPEWVRGRNLQPQMPLGSRYPLVSSDVRRADTGTLTVQTSSIAALNSLLALLDAAGPYLLQHPAGWDEPDRFVVVGDVSRARLSQSVDSYRVLQLPLMEVSRPITTGSRVSLPGKTFADALVAYPTFTLMAGTTFGALT